MGGYVSWYESISQHLFQFWICKAKETKDRNRKSLFRQHQHMSHADMGKRKNTETTPSSRRENVHIILRISSDQP